MYKRLGERDEELCVRKLLGRLEELLEEADEGSEGDEEEDGNENEYAG